MKFAIIALFLIAGVLCSACVAEAVAIGASPATLSFELPRKGYEEKTFQISTNDESGLMFGLEVYGDITQFVELSSKTGTTKLNQPAELTAKIKIPKDTIPGTYEGTINVVGSSSGSASNGTGSAIATGVAVRVIIKVTDEVAKTPVGNLAVFVLLAIVALVVGAALYVWKKKPGA